jgi:hypothetical protein
MKRGKMVKRCIGIDIGSTYISAVQMVRSAEQFYIEKTFRAQMRRSTDSPALHLKQLFSKNGFDRRANVAFSMPNNKVFFRRIESSKIGANHTNEDIYSIAGCEFPVQADQLVLPFQRASKLSESNHNVIAATTKDALRQTLDTVAEASIHPKLVEAAIFAAYLTVKVNYPEATSATCIVAYLDEHNLTMAVVENGSIVLVRNLPLISKESDARPNADQLAAVLRREAEVTWRRLYGTDIEEETKIFLVFSNSKEADIWPLLKQKLACQATIPDPCRMVKCSDDCNTDSTICTAEGLALGLLEPEQASGINFLDATDFEADPVPAIKKNLAICAALGAAIVAFLILGLFARLFYLEREYTSIKEGMKEILKNTVPDETAFVDPLAQLEQKLKPLQDDYKKFDPSSAGTAKPLEILRVISLSAPLQSNITVDNILLTNKSARLSGTSTSFKSVYDWQNQLKANPKFSAVDILDVGAAPASALRQEEAGVKFTILISLDSPEQI